ncbi:hypothetical protein [Aquibacillus sediminis]|uniref:hypothetical protein n=1 Tax=Aquibacillus sediminis TaxID=2574734 RepID=UPI001109277A|nr:hypothetical protein [Aquibacillus sediminis]
MREFQSLKILDTFKKGFEVFGVDYEVMRKILEVKLTMDQRRVPTMFNQSTKKKEDNNQFLKSLGMYLLMSLILIPLVLGDHYFFQMSLVFGIVMFIVMTSMISDFSTVLLDVRDKVIIGTKPVNARTINTAKVIHVTIYLFCITGTLTALPLIVSLVQQGFLFFIVFVVELILLSFLIIMFTALIYIGVLRFFDGEKLKDMINYVQIMLTMMMLVGYQLVIRSFEFVDFQMNITIHWWQYLIPPMWYGAAYEWLLQHNQGQSIMVLSILGLVVPILALLVYLRLIPSFERNLDKLLSQNTKATKRGTFYREWWANILCHTKEEKTFFLFANQMLSHEREFKLKVYPTIGFALFFPFLFLFNDLRLRSFAEMSNSKLFLTIYFCILIIPTGVQMIKFSENYQGAWIFKATPIKYVANMYRAATKALLIKLFFPVFLLLSVVFIFIFSIRIIVSLLVVGLTASLFSVICYKVLNKSDLPFTDSFAAAQQTETAKHFALFAVIGVFVGIHFFSLSVPYGEYVYFGVLAVTNWFIWRRVF